MRILRTDHVNQVTNKDTLLPPVYDTENSAMRAMMILANASALNFGDGPNVEIDITDGNSVTVSVGEVAKVTYTMVHNAYKVRGDATLAELVI